MMEKSYKYVISSFFGGFFHIPENNGTSPDGNLTMALLIFDFDVGAMDLL
jgi:hypothetical protein